LSDALTLAVAFAVALVLALALTPLAIRAAWRTDFLDHPEGYKQHERATPYLGGIAVVASFVVAAAVFASELRSLPAVFACMLMLLVIGTIDDRRRLGLGIRVLAVVAAGAILHVADLGWTIFDGTAADLVFTIIFVLGVVNAFNLMDNLDGATGSVAATGALGLGTLSALEGDVALGAFCLALAGACAGFLPYNLAQPGRIFLGDGGSMPIGLGLAAAMMNLPAAPGLDAEMVLLAVVLVGLPALDTTLVIVSRIRRGVTVLSGARDHLTHRLLVKLRSTRRVAAVLAVSQGLLGAAAIALHQLQPSLALAGSAACIALGMAVVAALEVPRSAEVRALEEAGA